LFFKPRQGRKMSAQGNALGPESAGDHEP